MLPVPDLPPRLIVDFAAKCNLRCSGCLVWGNEDDNKIDSVVGTIDVAAARKLLDEVAAAKPVVQPTMWGEPLLIPDLRERIRDMVSRGMTVAMNTNGLTLTDATATMLVEEGVSAVFFSIDAVHPRTLHAMRGIDKLAKIEAAVFRLLAARGNREQPRIGVSFTTSPDAANRDEEQAFIDRWSGIVDVVRIGQMFADGTFHGPQPKGERKPCPAIYSTLAVHNSGQVSVCCLDAYRETDLGDVLKDGAKAVWHGEEFTRVRKAHEEGDWDAVPFCKSCTGWAQHDFEEEVRDGFLIRRSPVYTYWNRMDRIGNWGKKRESTPSFRERA